MQSGKIYFQLVSTLTKRKGVLRPTNRTIRSPQNPVFKQIPLLRIFFLIAIAALLPFFTFSVVEAKTAIEVFEQASNSVVVVFNYNAAGEAQSQGSGVIMPSGDVVTNCHVIKNASRLSVYYQGKEYPALVKYTDWDRDVCSLMTNGLNAQSVIMGNSNQLKVGTHVYAIGAPKGLELSLSEGIVSSIREVEGGHYIQTTAPISPGSSGGGLFDDEGRLVGLPTFYLTEGQQLNFALPVEWIVELPKRHSGIVKKSQGEIQSIQRLAEQGDAQAQYKLARMYYTSQGVDRNYVEALKWYRLSAIQGMAEAQFYMGIMITLGQGVMQNDDEAFKWYRLAADQGLAAAQSMLGAAFAFGFGQGVTPNYSEALNWYRLAANKGYTEAQYSLGVMYENGMGIAQNYSEALKWYRLAANQGEAKAQRALGVLYGTGKGVTQNYSEALKWFLLAANQREAMAQSCLGSMYHFGQGVTQNDSEALKWYRLAADQGNTFAQNNLGVMYETGTVVTKNYSEALKWYRLAAVQGYKIAQSNLERLSAISHEIPPKKPSQYTSAPYKAKIASIIMQNWEFSKLLLKNSYGMDAYVRINILPNGTIKQIIFDKKSLSGYLNDSVKKALEKSSPLPALPKEEGVRDIWIGFVFTPEGIKR